MYFFRFYMRDVIRLKWGKTHMTSSLIDSISYIGFRQEIQAHITCLCFIFPEPKAREIYNTDMLYEPVLPV